MEFRHEAILYRGEGEFAESLLPFIEEGISNAEPVLIALDAEKTALLRNALGADRDSVEFIDMQELGRNPARIIPVWREFVERHGGHWPVRGVGEPVWPGRSADELVECAHHEALLNRAFHGIEDFTLLCPYDVDRLEPETVEAAHRTHPVVVEGGRRRSSDSYLDLDLAPNPLADALPPPSHEPDEFRFTIDDLSELRQFVWTRARDAGVAADRQSDIVLAASELAANSVRHGGGAGVARLWSHAGAVFCEVEDRGTLDDPLAGRKKPDVLQNGGRGLWLVNQLCDFVQLRSGPHGTVARVRVDSA